MNASEPPESDPRHPDVAGGAGAERHDDTERAHNPVGDVDADHDADPVRDESFEDMIHAVLEGPQDDPARRGLIKAIRQDQGAMRELRLAADTIAELRRPVVTPDFATQVLERTHQRRAFLPKGWRRVVDRGRLAAAACLLLALTGAAVFQRVAPDAASLTDQPRPISDVPRAIVDDASNSVTSFTRTVANARATLVPVPASAVSDQPATRLDAFLLQAVGADGTVSDSFRFVNAYGTSIGDGPYTVRVVRTSPAGADEGGSLLLIESAAPRSGAGLVGGLGGTDLDGLGLDADPVP